MGPAYEDVADRVLAAHRDPSLTVLEGVHALKHAVRFGARPLLVVTPDRGALARLLADVAPDVALPDTTIEVAPQSWATLTAGAPPPSPAVALAARPKVTPSDVLEATGRVVVLEDPRHAGNVGAVIRVAAAAGAGGVLVVGTLDPWHPSCVRAAAGLHFALPVARSSELADTVRPIVALDPTGTPLGDATLPGDAFVIFGTERHGLSDAMRARAGHILAIQMRPGVSSLNLATAVAVTLYTG